MILSRSIRANSYATSSGTNTPCCNNAALSTANSVCPSFPAASRFVWPTFIGLISITVWLSLPAVTLEVESTVTVFVLFTVAPSGTGKPYGTRDTEITLPSVRARLFPPSPWIASRFTFLTACTLLLFTTETESRSLMTAVTIGTAIVGSMPTVVITAFELALSRFGTPLLLRPDCRKTSLPLSVELSIVMALVTLAVVLASTPAPPPAYEATSRLPLGWRRDSARVASSRSPVLFSSVAPVTLIFALAVESIRDTPTATPNPETLSMRTLSYASALVSDSMRNKPCVWRVPWAVRRAAGPMSTTD